MQRPAASQAVVPPKQKPIRNTGGCRASICRLHEVQDVSAPVGRLGEAVLARIEGRVGVPLGEAAPQTVEQAGDQRVS